MATPAQNIRRKKAAKAYAIQHKIPLPKGFSISPWVGRPARALVRKIQAYAWPKLAPTGEFDTKTLALLFPPLPVGYRALRTAETQIGVKESPANSNSGPKVREYQNSTNPGTTGFPWCASFVTWCLRKNGWKVKFSNMGYVPSWIAEAHAGRNGLQVIPAKEAKAGDIATYDWEHDSIGDHIGFVKTPVDASGNFYAVEGNTSAGNNSNGGEVQERQRNVHDVAAFIRISPQG